MRKKFLLLFFVLNTILIFANGDKVLGKWITEKSKKGNQYIIEIYKTKEGKYNGKIKDLSIPKYTEGELKGQEKMDLKNPDKSLRTRSLKGIDFIYDLTQVEKGNEYKNGHMYLIPLGKTLYCKMVLKKDDTLLVKGSFDKTGLISKKQIWKRYNK